jgi:hypothetical protein
MLNPSVADANIDDPTIRKCIGFSKRWGFTEMEVVNLSPFRATKPKELLINKVPVFVKIENDDAIQDAIACFTTKRIVLAWGANGTDHFLDVQRVHDIIKQGWESDSGVQLQCLGRTKSNQPRHPLMLSYNTELENV